MPVKLLKNRKGTGKRHRTDKQAAAAERSIYVLQPLDPWLSCGPDTTVTELWKVLERRGTEKRIHLVYFDRYGWYCEHGRNCAAVPEVRRAARAVIESMSAAARSSSVRSRKRR